MTANLDGVFRREWGPAVAVIARWSGDLTVAEDAVQEACAEALRTWPRDGVPHHPGGWLVAVARNRARDRLTAGPSAIRDELCDEGVRLAGELCGLMPGELEARALAVGSLKPGAVDPRRSASS